MRHLFAIGAAALLWSTAAAFAADPVGSYSVEGTNPGSGSRYSGTVTVEKTGQTYRVIWVVAGTALCRHRDWRQGFPGGFL